jgi:sporulation protein YlmC with PRC-barrel domain/ElaB/YqjD/DUF883 family membrane-anchored ribosome-binding protein
MKTLLTTTSIALLMAVPAHAETSNMEKAGTHLEQAAEATGDAINETAQDAGQAAENTMQDIDQAMENTAEDLSQAADATAETVDQAARNTAEAIDEASAEIASEMTGPEMKLDGYSKVSHDMMTAEELTGVRVYDASEEWIGEIDSVVVTTNGEVDGAVIGVGGFLGIGEKDVLIDFSSVSLMKEDQSDNLRAFVDIDKEKLESMPRYEAS